MRQNITGCVVGATYQIAGWYRSNSNNGRARVRVSPTASTDWSTAVDLNPIADYGIGVTWTNFSGTVVATGTNMTLWLDGVQTSTVTGIANSTRRVDRIHLGAVSGIDLGTQGTYYFDAFASRRNTYIGP